MAAIKTLTTAQAELLAALRLACQADGCDATGWVSVRHALAARQTSTKRLPSGLQVRQRLATLARTGAIELVRIEGMGGNVTMYKPLHDAADAAQRR